MSAKDAMNWFNEAYEAINVVVDYDASWANGTGYFDKAVKNQELLNLLPDTGMMAKSLDPNNRKIIFLRGIGGIVVVFQRYSEGQNNVIVCNSPRVDWHLFNLSGGMWSGDKWLLVFGNISYETGLPNTIYHRLMDASEELFSALAKVKEEQYKR